MIYPYQELTSQAKFKSAVVGNLLQSWVNLTVDTEIHSFLNILNIRFLGKEEKVLIQILLIPHSISMLYNTM